MKNKAFLLFYICIMTFWLFSCAPSLEHKRLVINDPSNYVILGMWHGIIIPCAAAGKILGLNIGLYHAGKCNLSYWTGYVFALSFYFRIIRIFVLAAWEKKEKWFSKD